MKKIIISLIIIFLLFICFRFAFKIIDKNLNGDTDNENIGTVNKNEVNYLFFENGQKKDISFLLNKNINNLIKNIKYIVLLQDGDIMTSTNDVEMIIAQTVDNKITVRLNNYVNQFNRARLTLNNNEQIYLNIGQFYLEKVDEYPGADGIALVRSHSMIGNDNFTLDFTIKHNIPTKITFKYPVMLDSLKIRDNLIQISNIKNEISYTYHIEIQNQKDKHIIIELMCIGESDNIKKRIFKITTPLE
jgi:hypothetical protein